MKMNDNIKASNETLTDMALQLHNITLNIYIALITERTQAHYKT